MILDWFVDAGHVEGAIKHGKLIEEKCVECMPEKVSDAVVDENVDICLVRKYFIEDAWMIVSQVVQNKKSDMTWKCHVCYHDLHSKESILCDGCLLWYHFQCVALTKAPKAKTWFCRTCCGGSRRV